MKKLELSRTLSGKSRKDQRQAALNARRQAANFERFMQEKAGVFQVADVKDQAMFWAMH